MQKQIKEIIIMTSIFAISYVIIPVLILKYYSNNNLEKIAFLIISIIAFLSFATNLIYTYIRGKNIKIPLLSITTSLILFKIFNNSVIIIILIITILSILGHFLGTIFTKKENT